MDAHLTINSVADLLVCWNSAEKPLTAAIANGAAYGIVERIMAVLRNKPMQNSREEQLLEQLNSKVELKRRIINFLWGKLTLTLDEASAVQQLQKSVERSGDWVFLQKIQRAVEKRFACSTLPFEHTGLESIPTDVLVQHVFPYLDKKSRWSMHLVSSRFAKLLFDPHYLSRIINLKESVHFDAKQLTELLSRCGGHVVELDYPKLLNYRESVDPDSLTAMLAHCGNIEALNARQTAVTPKVIENCQHKLQMLKRLSFAECSYIDDRIIGLLEKFTNLEQVDLSGTAVTEAALPVLAKLTNLKELDLSANRFKWDRVFSIQGSSIKNLTKLRLSGKPIESACLEGIEDMTQLRELDLYDAGITDECMKRICTLTGLQNLNVGCALPTNTGVALISRLTALQVLSLERISFYPIDSGFLSLSCLTNLEFLDLKWHRIGNKGLKWLTTLTRLKGLNLSGTLVNDAGMIEVAQLSRLKELDLHNTKIGDAGVEALTRLKDLNSLAIDFTLATNKSCAYLYQFSNLKTLHLPMRMLTEEELRAFRRKFSGIVIVWEGG